MHPQSGIVIKGTLLRRHMVFGVIYRNTRGTSLYGFLCEFCAVLVLQVVFQRVGAVQAVALAESDSLQHKMDTVLVKERLD